MHYLSVNIVRFADDGRPGWVTCEFLDAQGRCHTLVDRFPLFASEQEGVATVFPRPGIVRCEQLRRWHDSRGRELVRVSTSSPDGVLSTEGLCEFTVLAGLVSAAPE
jgi:hypothetical protein